MDTNTMLFKMAASGKLDAVQILIENSGAEPSFTDCPHGCPPLFAAIQGGHLDVVKYLIEEHDVPTSATLTSGETSGTVTAVSKAAYHGQLHIVKYLVDKKEDIIHESYACEDDPVIMAAACSGNAEVVQYFVDKKCSVHYANSSGCTPLHYAARSPYDRVDAVAYLIDECGCDPLCPSNSGENSLHYACRHGCVNIVRYLVERKNIDPLRAYKGKSSPLHAASRANHLNVVQYITEERKMDPRKAQALIEGHPCFSAAYDGCLGIVQHFIENKHFELTDSGNFGYNIAEVSILGDNVDVLKYLIEEKGFDPLNMQHAVLQHAREHGEGKCAKYLMQHTHVKAYSEGNFSPEVAPEVIGLDMPQGEHVLLYTLQN